MTNRSDKNDPKRIPEDASESGKNGAAPIPYGEGLVLSIARAREGARLVLAEETREEGEATHELVKLYKNLAHPRTRDELNRAVERNLEGLVRAEILARRIEIEAGRLMEAILERVKSTITMEKKAVLVDAIGTERLSIAAFDAAGRLGRHVYIESPPAKLLQTKTTNAVSTGDIHQALERPLRNVADSGDIARHIEEYVGNLTKVIETKIQGHTAIAAEKMRMLGEIIQRIVEDLLIYERSNGNPQTFMRIQGAVLRLLTTLDGLMSHLETNLGQLGIFLKGVNTGIMLRTLLEEAREAGRRELQGGAGANPETVKKIQLLRERELVAPKRFSKT
ncbi:MAG: hypothetical protein AAB551_00900 [Patescibacteria group bacterium]